MSAEKLQSASRRAEDARPLILHIITGLNTGGAETALLRLSSKAARYRHAVVSLGETGTIGPRLEAAGVPVYALRMGNPARLALAPMRLRTLVRKLEPAIVQGWLVHGNLAAAWAARSQNARLVWSVRQSVVDFKYEKRATAALLWFSGRIAGTADRIVYNSMPGQRDHERLGYPPAAGMRIPNGFDVSVFAPSATERHRMRDALGVQEHELLIGLIGRFDPYKNHAGFFAAADALLRRSDRPLRFLLAGSGTQIENPSIRAMLTSPGLMERTLLLGDRQDIVDVTRALDIAVNCSFGEGFANAIGEAMACGVPCVATDVGDSAWVVGDTGTIVPPDDTAQLVDALERMIHLDGPSRIALGMAARQRVIDHFSLQVVVARYEDLYADLIGKAASIPPSSDA